MEEYFFSVLTLVQNEENVLLEFVTHYLEEGAEHIFIVDDNSRPGSIEAPLANISRALFSVIPASCRHHTKERQVRHHKYEWQVCEYNSMLPVLRSKTKWVAVVDADEFIASRAFPERTIASILHEELAVCDDVVVPWILYSWDGRLHNPPPGELRTTLTTRWPFNVKIKESVNFRKFRDRNKRIEYKSIFKPSKAKKFFSPHQIRLVEWGSRLCMTNARVHNSKAPRTWYYHSGTHRNTVQVAETSVDWLLLATHHYRVKSEDDWSLKRSRDVFSNSYSHEAKVFADRPGYFDDFMLRRSVLRQPARIGGTFNSTLKEVGTHTERKGSGLQLGIVNHLEHPT